VLWRTPVHFIIEGKQRERGRSWGLNIPLKGTISLTLLLPSRPYLLKIAPSPIASQVGDQAFNTEAFVCISDTSIAVCYGHSQLPITYGFNKNL
jgi:hypothetical protein